MSSSNQETFLSSSPVRDTVRSKTKLKKVENINKRELKPARERRPSKTVHEALECESEESHENDEARGHRNYRNHRYHRNQRRTPSGAALSPGGAAVCGGARAPSEGRARERGGRCPEERERVSGLSTVKCPVRGAARYLRGCLPVCLSSVCPTGGFKRRSCCSA